MTYTPKSQRGKSNPDQDDRQYMIERIEGYTGVKSKGWTQFSTKELQHMLLVLTGLDDMLARRILKERPGLMVLPSKYKPKS